MDPCLFAVNDFSYVAVLTLQSSRQMTVKVQLDFHLYESKIV